MAFAVEETSQKERRDKQFMREEGFFHKWRKERASPRKMVAALLAVAIASTGTAAVLVMRRKKKM